MKRILALLIATLLIPCLCLARSTTVVVGQPTAAAPACADSSCTGYLVCQNFENAGYDNSETWTETIGTGGSVDEDDTTATVLRGSQQLSIYAGDAGQNSRTNKTFSALDDVWVHFAFKTSDATPSASYALLQIDNSGSGGGVVLYHRASGDLRIEHGGVTKTTTTVPLADNTEIHIWLHIIKGTGSNGEMHLYYAADGTRPASPANTCGGACSITTGTASSYSFDQVSFRAYNQQTNYFDEVLVDNAEIGDVCN